MVHPVGPDGTRRHASSGYPDGGQLVCLRLGLDQKRDGTLQEQRNYREFLLLRPLRRSHAKGQHHQSIKGCLVPALRILDYISENMQKFNVDPTIYGNITVKLSNIINQIRLL